MKISRRDQTIITSAYCSDEHTMYVVNAIDTLLWHDEEACFLYTTGNAITANPDDPYHDVRVTFSSCRIID